MTTPRIFTDGFSAAALRWPKRGEHFNLPHLDAAENLAFLRELEFISKRALEKRYATLKGRTHVPTMNEGMSPIQTAYTWRLYDAKGEAKRITDMSDDLPAVNLHGTEQSQRIQAYGVSFNYSIDEVQAMALLGRSLEQDRANVARKVLEQKIDQISFNGDSAAGLKGIANLSGTATATPATKGGGGTTWAIATADELIEDLNTLVRQQAVDTLEIERPTKILMPTSQFQIISNKRVSALSDRTVLNWWMGNNPGISVESWERLAGAGTNGVDRLIAYEPTEENVKLLMPLEFTMQPPQLRNMSYVVNCWVKSGGVVNPYPKAVLYMDGV